MKKIALSPKAEAWVYPAAIIVLVISAFIAGIFYDGFSIVFGLSISIMLFISAFIIRFGGSRTDEFRRNFWSYLMPVPLIFIMTTGCYTAFVMNKYGKFAEGKVQKVESHVESRRAGMDNVLVDITVHECKVDNFPWKFRCNENVKVGQTIRYFYAGDVGSGDIKESPIIVGHDASKFQVILSQSGSQFLAAMLFIVSFGLIWLVGLYNRGIEQLNVKIAGEKMYMRVTYTLFFFLSFFTFVLFILAVFKNIYLIVYQHYWNLLLVTLVAWIILVTDIAEKLFSFSTSLILEIRSYTVVKLIKNLIKVSGYISFALLLISSLRRDDKNIFDLLFDFFKNNLGMSIKTFSDWFHNPVH